jgi:hypothetical protein
MAQDCLEPVGQWRYGVSNGVAAEGDRAVLANGAVLQVLDLTTPSDPSVAGELTLESEIRAVAISGTRAYAQSHDHLHVIDFSGPEPTQLGILSGIGSPHSLAVAGGFVYALNHDSLSIFDVSVPSTPTYQGGLQWAEGYPSDVQVVSTHAYVVDTSHGLRVVDVVDPTAPVEIGGLDLGANTSMWRLDIIDGLAYVVGSDSSDFSRRLWVIDLADPASPGLVSNTTVVGSQDIVVSQGVASIADFRYLTTYDVTDPLNPGYLGQAAVPYYSFGGPQHRLAAVDGFTLMTAELHGLGVYDVGDPSTPARVAEVGAPGQLEDAAYSDGVLFVAAGGRGFRAVDVSDPTLPVELGFTVIPQQLDIWGVAAAGSIAYASGFSSAGLVALDESDPGVPVILGNVQGATGNWVTLAGEYGYVLNEWGGGLHVVDLSSPGQPMLVGSVDLEPGEWQWPVVIGDHVIVRRIDNDPSVVVIDVSDPTTLAQLAEIDVWTNFGGLAVTDSWLLVPDIIDGLESAIRVFDMRDPAHPVEVAPYHPVGGAVEVIGVAGSVAYLSILDGWPQQPGAIEAVNFADPTNPVFMGLLPRSGRVKRLAFSSQEIFVFDRQSGFDTFTLCQGPLFADSFETGDATAWSGVMP